MSASASILTGRFFLQCNFESCFFRLCFPRASESPWHHLCCSPGAEPQGPTCTVREGGSLAYHPGERRGCEGPPVTPHWGSHLHGGISLPPHF